VDVIGRRHAANDVDTSLAANLTADIPYAQPDITREHLVAILREPDDVVTVIKTQWLPVSYCIFLLFEK